MIDCKECNDYAQLIFSRGEIAQDEIEKLVIDRHILKGCDKMTDATFNVDEMNLPQLKDSLKMLIRLANHEHERLTALQERVLEIEKKIFENEATLDG